MRDCKPIKTAPAQQVIYAISHYRRWLYSEMSRYLEARYGGAVMEVVPLQVNKH